ncbi:hypothetical protein L6R49_02010 [Myxococcota bacterium]|nr:hypothetical protein [Myxococcota bacterium]
MWLFPLEHGKLEFELKNSQGGRAWTGGFVMKLAEPMTPDHRENLEAELIRIARLVAAHQETGPSRDVLLFPELCLDKQGVVALRRALSEAGARPALMIAGSHHAPVDGHAAVDGHAPLMRALAPIFADCEEEPLWHHQKRGPFRVTGEEWKKMYPKTAGPLQAEDELWEYIVPGDTFTTFDGPGGRVGVLICADLLEERFPAMRDLVRIALVDLLLVVNYSTKTTPFLRHAEQLNRLGVCAVFLNAAGALPVPNRASDPTKGQPIDPFSALVALPQLAPRGAAERPTWLTWRHTDQRVDVQDKKGWLEVLSDGVVAKFHHPAAILVDLNEWLVDPAEPTLYNDPVVHALGDAIQAALTDNTRSREDRIAALRAEEKQVLPTLGASLPGKAQTLLLKLHHGGIFVPIGVEHGDTLNTLFAMRLARPHRLAIPLTRGDSKKAESNNTNDDSSFIVSLTPLGRALVEHLEKPARSTRLGA